MKLSEPQEQLLRAMAADRRCMAMRPGGYPSAGRDAANFDRVGHVLVAHGLAQWTSALNLLVTDAGLAWVRARSSFGQLNAPPSFYRRFISGHLGRELTVEEWEELAVFMGVDSGRTLREQIRLADEILTEIFVEEQPS